MTPGLEGARHYYSGGSLTDCPYPVGSKECEQWTGRFVAARETWQCPWCRVHFHVDKLSDGVLATKEKMRCPEPNCSLLFNEYNADQIRNVSWGAHQMHTTAKDLRWAGRGGK